MTVRRWLGAALAAAALAVVGWSSQARLPLVGDEAVLRLSWRTDGETLDDCLALTGEQLALLPAGERAAAASCRPRAAPYRLEVLIDGTTAVVDTVRAAGARHDRPIYVLRDVPTTPGTRDVVIRFTPLLEDGSGATAASALLLDASVDLGPHDVALVTYDEDLGRLVVRRGPN